MASQVSEAADWRERYKEMLATPEEAIQRIRPGQRIFVGTACAQPGELVRALAARWRELPDTEIVHLLTLGEAPYAQKELSRHFRVNSFFIAENVRDIIQEGLGDYTPIFLSDIPRLFRSGRLALDVALIQVAPPDRRGMCSLGISVDVTKAAAESAMLVIAQVNPRMPRTLGDSAIHVRDFDVLVPVDAPLVEAAPPPVTEITRQIGRFIAGLVEDGSTVELGIGRIPQAVLEFLGERRDLGIHTEMFTDAIIDMIEAGIITGRRKTLDRGKVVASFCLGTRRLYDYIHENPLFAFHPTEYVNDPYVIGRQHKMVAINVALEVDLTGQVCADSLGARFYSGIGGQVDFNRGAARSAGGKAIIALPSTAMGGEVSRIVSRLSPGAGVVTTRGDVHYVVTEYGVAYLHGKSVQERAIALITIAHPDFRERLLKEAIEARYLQPEMTAMEGKIHIGPPELRTTLVLHDGTQVHFRPIHPTDVPRMKDLFHALSQQAINFRFMTSQSKGVSLKQIQNFVYVDHRNEVTIVGTIPEAHGEDIFAMGDYYLDPRTNLAEVAFIVRDDWQGKGIGKFLLRHLASIARRNGIAGFTAEVLAQNRAMGKVFESSGLQVTSSLEEGVYSYKLLFP